jgi:putative ATPase
MYDKNGEMHYDIVSAYIKSIRGSDPNAAIYWLARMIEGGEDPKFIARRLLISASEDIGLANPNALLMANACFQAVDSIGWPEARIVLAECTIYLASSAKGNAAYAAINKAQELVKQTGNLSVPVALRNAPTGAGARQANGKLECSGRFKKCTYKTHERTRVRREISILTRLSGKFCRAGIYA